MGSVTPGVVTQFSSQFEVDFLSGPVKLIRHSGTITGRLLARCCHENREFSELIDLPSTTRTALVYTQRRLSNRTAGPHGPRSSGPRSTRTTGLGCFPSP